MFKVKRRSMDIYCEDLGTRRNDIINKYFEDNFDVKYREVGEDRCVYYRIRVTRKERRKLIKFLNHFDEYWFGVIVMGDFIELFSI